MKREQTFFIYKIKYRIKSVYGKLWWKMLNIPRVNLSLPVKAVWT